MSDDRSTEAAGPLRIVHCFRNPIGGLFRHVRDLCGAQARAGHMVGIVCDSTTGGAFEERLFAELSPALALGLHRVPMERSIALSDLSGARRVHRAAKPLSPDVLHGHGAKGGAYARIGGTFLRASGNRVARIYTPHGGSLHYDPKPLKNRVYFMAERVLETMTDAFIFVSRYEANAYATKVHPPKPIAKIIPNGLREEEFVPVQPAADASDFLYVGMLRDLKGVDVFIGALALLRDRGHPYTANIFGAGDDAERYRAMVAELRLDDAVAFHEPTPARIAFATGRVLVIPSRAESMPYIVLEAAAGAIPMIATRVGGIPEIFGDKSDRLVEPGSIDSLAAAMEAAAANRAAAERMAADLRDEVRQVHTVDAMAAGVEGVYRAAISRRRGAA
ncbi:MAG: glycosyltransferase family 4 protein [Bauldia sp.]|nr:glycosyltransferase family 4 protein [Bauldia sp.]